MRIKWPVLCSTGEVCTNYSDYLKTNHWRDVKLRYKKSKLFFGYCVCGEFKHLHLHHKTYKRIGKEWLTDLVMLCSSCHNLCHNLQHTCNKSAGLAGATRKATRIIKRITKRAIRDGNKEYY